eukprot:743010-Amphidinium_carterae.1
MTAKKQETLPVKDQHAKLPAQARRRQTPPKWIRRRSWFRKLWLPGTPCERSRSMSTCVVGVCPRKGCPSPRKRPKYPAVFHIGVTGGVCSGKGGQRRCGGTVCR